MTLPADNYLIEALEVSGGAGPVKLVKDNPGGWRSTIAHAHALERIAELEAGSGKNRDEFFARITNLEGALADKQRMVRKIVAQRDEALAKLAQYEPRVDPDLALAREVAGAFYRQWGVLAVAQKIEAGEHDDSSYVQCALAGIKAGRAGGGL